MPKLFHYQELNLNNPERGNKMRSKLILGMVLALALVFGVNGRAIATATATVADLTVSGETMGPGNSDPYLNPVLSVTFADITAGETISSMKIQADQVTAATFTAGLATSTELLDLTATGGGIQVWQEDGTTTGFQPGEDAEVTTSVTIYTAAQPATNAEFLFSPTNNNNLSTSAIYYVVLKSDGSNITDGNSFTIGIDAVAGDITTSLGNVTPNAVTTDTITMDETLPTVSSATQYDMNGNGQVDKVVVEFDEVVWSASGFAAAGSGVRFNNASGSQIDILSASPTDTTGTDKKVTFYLDENDSDNDYNTAYDAADLIVTGGDILDLYGNDLADIASGDLAETDAMAPVVDPTSGIEIYDAYDDSACTSAGQDGRIDKISLHFTEDIKGTSVPDYDGFAVAGYSFLSSKNPTVTNEVVDLYLDRSADVRNGTGFDTGALPQVTYSSAMGDVTDDATTPNDLENIGINSAVEVDKAVPILLSATTQDADLDGVIDGYKLIFSEHVDVTSGNLTDGFSFITGGFSWASSGHTTISDTVLLKINETTVNSGIIPAFGYTQAANQLNDGATDATGAPDVNYYATENPIPGSKTHDGVSPILMSVKTGDNDRDGKLDSIVVTFSEPMKDAIDYSTGVTIAGHTVTRTVHSSGSAVVGYIINEGSGYDTDDTPNWSYNSAGGAIVDANDFPLRTIAVDEYTTEDAAPPMVVSAVTGDTLEAGETHGDGEIDHYVLTFSEPITDFAIPADYDNNFAIAGHTINEALTEKTSDALTFYFNESGSYDSDAKPQATYIKDGSDDIKDLADVPMESIVDADLTETDGAPPIIVGTGRTDDVNNDGYIDAFTLYFSEPIAVPISTQTGIVVDPAGGNTVTIDSVANIDAANEKAIFYGTNDGVGTENWDTDETPEIDFVPTLGTINDTLLHNPNSMLSSTDNATADYAAPALVKAVGVVASTQLTIRFSEPVDNGLGGDLDAADFVYINHFDTTADNATTVSTIDGETGLNGADGLLTGDVDHNFLPQDVEQDSLSIADNAIYDVSVQSNKCILDTVTLNDVVAPWIVEMRTIDYDEDGLIDYLRLEMSESIDDARLYGYLQADTLSAYIGDKFDVAGFTGEKWNLYTSDPSSYTQKTLPNATIVRYNSARSHIHFLENGVNDNILYVQLDESPAPVNPYTGIGNTDATPICTIADSVLSDMKPNYMAATTETAMDKVGPAIMEAKTLSTTVVEAKMSEDLRGNSVDQWDFELYMGNLSNPKEFDEATEKTPGVVILRVAPKDEWVYYQEGTVAFDGTVYDDIPGTDNKNYQSAYIDVTFGFGVIDPPHDLNAYDTPGDANSVTLSFIKSANHPGTDVYTPILGYIAFRSQDSTDTNPTMLPYFYRAYPQDNDTVVVEVTDVDNTGFYYWVAAYAGPDLPPGSGKLGDGDVICLDKDQMNAIIGKSEEFIALSGLSNCNYAISNNDLNVGDLNSDNRVGIDDYFALIDVFGFQCGDDFYEGFYDLNQEGGSYCRVDLDDYFNLIDLFGTQYSALGKVASVSHKEVGVNKEASIALNLDKSSTKDYIQVDVVAKGIQELSAYVLTITYDRDKLELIEVKDAGFLNRNGGVTPIVYTHKENGEVTIANTIRRATVKTASKGDGILATLRFKMSSLRNDGVEVTEARLLDISRGNNYISVAKLDVSSAFLPKVYNLAQNYPNPFNPDTRINYDLPKDGKVNLVVYNTLGQKVRTLVDGQVEAGYRYVVWDGRDAFGVSVASGVYFYRLKAGDFTAVKRMMLLK